MWEHIIASSLWAKAVVRSAHQYHHEIDRNDYRDHVLDRLARNLSLSSKTYLSEGALHTAFFSGIPPKVRGLIVTDRKGT